MRMGKIFVVFIGILLWSNSLKLWAGCEWQIDCDEGYWHMFNWPDQSMMGDMDPHATIWYEDPEKALADSAAGKDVRFLSYELDSDSSDSIDEFLQKAKKIPELSHLRISITSAKEIDIPSSIGELDTLVSLSLYANYRINFPDTMANLTKLVYLRIRSDYSGGMPTELCRVSSLQYLDLTDDDLRELPECIGDLLNLDFLIIRSNPLQKLPMTVLNLVHTTIKLGLSPYLIPMYTDTYDEADIGNIYIGYSGSYDLLKKYLDDKDFEFKTSSKVTATSGLRMRDKPSLHGKKLGIVPHDRRVLVLEKSTNIETIDDKTANWYKIRTIINGKITEGWVWGAYLE